MALTPSPSLPPSLADRIAILNHDVKETEKTYVLSVMSYNVLADCHVRRGDYSYTPSEYTQTDFRFPSIIQEVTHIKADVVCLQEVSPVFFQLLQKSMNGYSGVYIKRSDAYHEEGCATFCNADKFKVVDNTLCEIGDLVQKIIPTDIPEEMKEAAYARYVRRPEVAILTVLELRATGAMVTIANTHIVFGDMEKPDIQTLQIASVRQVLAAKLQDTPVILCGDFNVFPGSPPYILATVGAIDDSLTRAVVQEAAIEGDIADVFQRLLEACCPPGGGIPLISSYKQLLGHEPTVTTVDNIWRVCCDYVLYGNSAHREHTGSGDGTTEQPAGDREHTGSGDGTTEQPAGQTTRDLLVPLHVLGTPPLEAILRAVPPSKQFPSDHLPLLVTFGVLRK